MAPPGAAWRSGCMFNEIIRRQGIALDPARIEARLDEMAGAYGDAAALKRAYRQNADAMRQVESMALEDQVVDWILAHAKVQRRRPRLQGSDEVRGLIRAPALEMPAGH